MLEKTTFQILYTSLDLLFLRNLWPAGRGKGCCPVLPLHWSRDGLAGARREHFVSQIPGWKLVGLSHHRSAMAVDKHFLGRRQPLESSTINPSPLGSVKAGRTSPGPAGVTGGVVAPKTWGQKRNESFSNVHLPRQLESYFCFFLGFPYPHKLLLNA